MTIALQKILPIIFLITAVLFLVPQFSHGAITLFNEEINCDPKLPPSAIGVGGATSGCGFVHFIQAIKAIIGFLVRIAIPLGAVFILYGGFVIMTASGSPEKVAKGKKVVTSTAIGLAILLGAWLILFTVFQILGPVSKPLLIQIREILF